MFHRNTLLIFITFVLTSILSPLAAQAQVKQVHLRVDGLACPFCAYGLEKKVSKLAGYEADSYKVKINEGMVSFGWRNNQPLDLEALERAVKKAGFTLRGVTGQFIGTLEKGEDQYVLRLLAPFDQQFVLQEAAGDTGRGSAPPSRSPGDRLKERLESMIADGNAVEIVGTARGGRDAYALDTIVVTELKVPQPPAESGAKLVLEVKDLRCGGGVARLVQAVGPLDDVLHVRADCTDDRVEIWTRLNAPDLDALQKEIESLGFTVRRLAQGPRDSTGGFGG